MNDARHDDNGSTGAAWARWEDRPTTQQRTAVQQAVTGLFDQLAPEKTPARGAEPVPSLQRIRSPRGCILQASDRAVTVSWFPALGTDATLGELQLIIWEGTVARPGAARRPGDRAQALQQEVLRPTEAAGRWSWAAPDGKTYDAAALAARCMAMLVDELPPAPAAV